MKSKTLFLIGSIFTAFIGCKRFNYDSLRGNDGRANPDTHYDASTQDGHKQKDLNINDLGNRDLTQDFGNNFDMQKQDMPNDLGRDINQDVYAADRLDLGAERDLQISDGLRDQGGDISLRHDMLAQDMPRDLGIQDALDAGIRDTGTDTGRDIGRDITPDIGNPPLEYICDEATVALYHLNDPDPMLDSCGNNHLTDFGTSSVVGQEGFGQARDFYGDADYLIASDDSSFATNFGGLDDFTIEARFRTNTLPDETDTLVGKLPSVAPTVSVSGYGIIYTAGRNFPDTGWACTLYESSFYSYVNSGPALSTAGIEPALNDDQWHSIACVRSNEGTTLSIYIDGVNRGTSTIGLRNINNSAPLTLGNTINGIAEGTQDFDGEIDEVRVSNTARDYN